MFTEMVVVFSENHTEHTNTLCEQNTEFLNAKACGVYSYQCDL
jgi:hypothetical protein